MGSLGPITTSGEGNQSLGAAQTLIALEAKLVTFNPAQTRFVGNAFPRGVWHVGCCGFGTFPGDPFNPLEGRQTFVRFLHAEHQEWDVPASNAGVYVAPSMWWKWLPGVTVQLTAYW